MTIFFQEFMRVEVFTRRIAARHKEEMVSHQRSWIGNGKDRVDDHRERDAPMIYTFRKTDMALICIHNNLRQTRSKYIKSQKRTCRKEHEEIPVIATAYTVVDPDAMVVLRFDAVVADAAVVAPGWSPDIAGFAVLCGHFHGCCAGGGGFY